MELLMTLNDHNHPKSPHFYSIPIGSGVSYYDERICVSACVCVSVCKYISRTTCPVFT